MPTLNLQVSANADDAHEHDDGTSFSSSSNNVNVRAHTSGGTRYNGGARFTNVTVPNGATITAASLTVDRATGFDTENDILVDILGEDVDNSVNFSTNPDVTSRVRTTASVFWSKTDIVDGEVSPDISAVIQEIVDRAGWASGNALTILIDGRSTASSSCRLASMEDTGSRESIRLSITYASNQESSVAGTITPSGGNIGTVHGLETGILSPIGLHLGFLTKLLSGTLTPGGAASFLTPFTAAVAGTITPAGTITSFRSLSATLAGTITPVGVHVAKMIQSFAGSMSSAGTMSLAGLQSFAGSITPSGTIAVVRNLSFDGLIEPIGSLLGQVVMTLQGVIAPFGVMSFLLPPLRIVGRLRAYVTDRDGTPKGNIL